MANITIPPGLQAAGSGLATEVTLTATNTKLDTLIAQTDTLEVSVGDVDVNTDGLEALATATNTKLDTLITQTDTIETVLMSIDDGLPNALGRQAAAASTGVVLSTEDKAVLDGLKVSIDALVAKTISVGVLDQDPVLIAGTSIQGSAGTRFLAATLAADVKRIRWSDTTGLFIGVYDSLAAGHLLHIVNPGFDGYIDQEFASGTTLYLISMTTDAGTLGSYLSLNFLG